jgi:hypothetical protein
MSVTFQRSSSGGLPWVARQQQGAVTLSRHCKHSLDAIDDDNGRHPADAGRTRYHSGIHSHFTHLHLSDAGLCQGRHGAEHDRGEARAPSTVPGPSQRSAQIAVTLQSNDWHLAPYRLCR